MGTHRERNEYQSAMLLITHQMFARARAGHEELRIRQVHPGDTMRGMGQLLPPSLVHRQGAA